ncbi:hypothetical protein PPACK8108_LOCUS24282 [Phakopsora pachyrhizi]|uniref:Uncharacterized protein n=1 Tax=Phakopsora pachyrhizi TaxID=170000 RepID=A0AAV0BUB9_PHAPC|nr:hypothetical protein PPACK8108_LOCUS24282 [Phakopsora pachyrhizi]
MSAFKDSLQIQPGKHGAVLINPGPLPMIKNPGEDLMNVIQAKANSLLSNVAAYISRPQRFNGESTSRVNSPNKTTFQEHVQEIDAEKNPIESLEHKEELFNVNKSFTEKVSGQEIIKKDSVPTQVMSELINKSKAHMYERQMVKDKDDELRLGLNNKLKNIRLLLVTTGSTQQSGSNSKQSIDHSN